MPLKKRTITLTVNNERRRLRIDPNETLLDVLRRASYLSVKRGCDNGACGVCLVLLNSNPVRSCMIRAEEAGGAVVLTVEGLASPTGPHPIQRAFIETGAIQCGFCTPGQELAAKALLDRNPDPTEKEVRQALAGVLCRCTGYVRPVEAVLRAAAAQRGEKLPSVSPIRKVLPQDGASFDLPDAYFRRDGVGGALPPLAFSPAGMDTTLVVGQPEAKVDAEKLVRGRPVFTDDIRLEGMLYGALLTSPHAHARIKQIDASSARSLPGVHAVLTFQDIPRVKHTSGGQSYPQPLPYDQVCLDNKVRHAGDRVAVVAAETPEMALRALERIDIEYEILPAVVDPVKAMGDEAPVIHDEPDTQGIHNRERNIVHHIQAQVGDVETALADADHVFEGEYRTPKQQHVHLEPHVCITYWDEDARLMVRTSTQVPFHIRRMLAPLIGLPVKRIRVVKPRVGGGFGNKQEMILEDLCAHLTLATGRPVRMEFSRTQEFTSSRCRHAQIMRYRIGVKDGKVTAADLYLIGDTGAYGTHGLTVQMVGGFKGLTLYNAPNSRFVCDVVYTNTPPGGAFRGYGAMQCQFGVEVLMEEIAERLGLDVVEFKRANWIRVGEKMHLSRALGEGREGVEQVLSSSGLDPCVAIGLQATDFYAKRKANRGQTGRHRRGIGMAVVMHGSGVAGLDMASATIKMNDDGSFNLLIGATDLGTGSDTILAQMAAEDLGVRVDDIIVHSSDTDFTPFDKGAYASSTTYVSGGAVRKAAMQVRDQIREYAAGMLEGVSPEELTLEAGNVVAPDGRSVTLGEVALSSLHQQDQRQIIASASHVSQVSPPPTAAQFVEVVVDTKTGHVRPERMLMAVDCGRVINPMTATGQVEGGMAQALGFALTEEMLFDREGRPLNPRLGPYAIPRAGDMPLMDVIFVETDEPSGPFGAKSVAEISIDGVAPAMVSAVHDATGAWVRELPLTPERVLEALRRRGGEWAYTNEKRSEPGQGFLPG
jgi:putative selenate reductase molybdopterin-binding subunit